jgi:hypothetical protein
METHIYGGFRFGATFLHVDTLMHLWSSVSSVKLVDKDIDQALVYPSKPAPFPS